MPKVYKIHPAIGFARVGPSPNGYFLAPEAEGAAPIELSATGQEAPFTGYKDAAHLIRRQAARFRVFEYDKDAATGAETLQREITADHATITWRVTLGSRKAAGKVMQHHELGDLDVIVPSTADRNTPPAGFTHDDLAASVALSVSGRSQVPATPPQATLLGKPFYIGEARTDHHGRLVVLGGMGVADTWLAGPTATLSNFLNNPGWYDDIADGPVDASVTLNGEAASVGAVGAWVVVAPPDFAPNIIAITTLHDIVVQALRPQLPAQISYVQDIEPILRRAGGLKWVNRTTINREWDKIQSALDQGAPLADPSPAQRPLRKSIRDTVRSSVDDMNRFSLTKRQMDLLDKWRDGQFIPGPDPTRPAADAAGALDIASLSATVGGGFYPGIEAGVLLRNANAYAEFGRLTRGDFADWPSGATIRLKPGALTERMACPWQADFVECEGNWWPAQRPDIARYNGQGIEQNPPLEWHRSVVGPGGSDSPDSRFGMVKKFARLGIIEPMTVGGKTVYGEVGRDPALDTGDV